MAATRGPGLPGGVKQLRRRIDRWRWTREKQTAMPADLWSKTIALARRGRPYTVARALGVNYESLKRRMAEASPGDGGAGSGFVEFTGAELLQSTPGAVVELSDADGMRLTVRLMPRAEVDVARIVAAFRQGRA